MLEWMADIEHANDETIATGDSMMGWVRSLNTEIRKSTFLIPGAGVRLNCIKLGSNFFFPP